MIIVNGIILLCVLLVKLLTRISYSPKGTQVIFSAGSAEPPLTFASKSSLVS